MYIIIQYHTQYYTSFLSTSVTDFYFDIEELLLLPSDRVYHHLPVQEANIKLFTVQYNREGKKIFMFKKS